jgi:hypothetical protein
MVFASMSPASLPKPEIPSRLDPQSRVTSLTKPGDGKHRLPSLPGLVIGPNKPHDDGGEYSTWGDGEMPITELYLPVLSRFLCAVEMTTGLPPQPLDASPEQLQRVEQQENEKKTLPKGVVLGPDGKP